MVERIIENSRFHWFMVVIVCLLGVPSLAKLSLQELWDGNDWIEIHSVTVPDFTVGEDPMLEVDQTYYVPRFDASYHVQIRDARTDELICQNQPPTTIRYREASEGHVDDLWSGEEPEGFVFNWQMTWWFGETYDVYNADCFDSQRRRAWGSEFYLLTCRTIYTTYPFIGNIEYTTEPCNRSNTFYIWAEEGPYRKRLKDIEEKVQEQQEIIDIIPRVFE